MVFVIIIDIIMRTIMLLLVYNYHHHHHHHHYHYQPVYDTLRLGPIRFWRICYGRVVNTLNTAVVEVLSVSPTPVHYVDVIMTTKASQITSLTIVYPTVYSGADQRKHQRSASLAFLWGIHLWPVYSPHKGSVTQKMFSFDDVIIGWRCRMWAPGPDIRYWRPSYEAIRS